MTVVLDHTIVPAADRGRSARFLADLLGLAVGDPAGPFTPVRVNGDLTLDFDDRHPFLPGHYAFRVDGATFARVLARLEAAADVPFGAGPGAGWDRSTYRVEGDRGVYVQGPEGHTYEFLTAEP